MVLYQRLKNITRMDTLRNMIMQKHCSATNHTWMRLRAKLRNSALYNNVPSNILERKKQLTVSYVEMMTSSLGKILVSFSSQTRQIFVARSSITGVEVQASIIHEQPAWTTAHHIQHRYIVQRQTKKLRRRTDRIIYYSCKTKIMKKMNSMTL